MTGDLPSGLVAVVQASACEPTWVDRSSQRMHRQTFATRKHILENSRNLCDVRNFCGKLFKIFHFFLFSIFCVFFALNGPSPISHSSVVSEVAEKFPLAAKLLGEQISPKFWVGRH